MSGFIDESDRFQGMLLPERVDEYVSDENPVRIIDALIGELDLAKLGFEGMELKSTGRPGYHPATMLKIYLYGYLNRIQSSRRLEQEARRNLELMWLVGRLAPDFKTLADFRAENAATIKNVCRENPMRTLLAIPLCASRLAQSGCSWRLPTAWVERTAALGALHQVMASPL
jgi:transposase